MGTKRYQLKEDTVLDGRYRIGRVLGEGGFGITYEGVNQRIGMRVAIKEFFCRDYMDRDNETSEAVFLSEPEMQERFLSEKQKFLKEARILSDFSAEAEVVHINDYFELNGTAYIVMTYLDGKTLRQYVGENGPFDHETLFRKFKPLLATLEKIHETGLIHRDISPDNIMLLSDGSLCLIDFGAAYHYDHKTKSYTIISKHGYAAPEQYKTDGKIGPAVDVYALAATLYFCLTGTDPEDSLQRILLDDLKMPSELGVSIPHGAEDVLSKGLELKEEKRFGSVREMLEKIDHVYPEKTEEPDKKRKFIIAGVIAAAAVVCLIIGLTWYNAHKMELRFRNIETETIWLVSDEDMTVAEYSNAEKTVKERLEIFAGKDNYLWEERNGEIRLELPVGSLCGRDPGYVCKAYLTRPLQTYFFYPGKDSWSQEEVEEQAGLLPRDAFEKVELLTGEIPDIDRTDNRLPETGDYKYIRITLTEQVADAVNQAFANVLQSNERVCLYYDVYENLAPTYHEPCRCVGDGRSFDIINWDQEGNFFDVLYYNLTHEPSACPFGVYENWIVETEDELKNIATGKNQVPDGSLTGEVMQLRFTTDINIEEQKASWFHNLIAFKDRLDALEVPYEFYLMENEQLAQKSTFVVVFQKDAVSQYILEMITKKYLFNYIGSEWGKTAASFSTIRFEQEKIRGTLSDYNAERMSDLLTAFEQAGVQHAVLYLGDLPAARCSLEEFKEGIEDREVCFSEILFADTAEEYDRATRLLLLMQKQELASSLELYGIYYTDRQKNTRPDWISDRERIESLTYPYHELPQLVESLKAFMASRQGELVYSYDPSDGMKFYFYLFRQNADTLAADLIDFAEELQDAFGEELNSPLVESYVASLCLGEKGDKARNDLVLWFERSPERCCLELSPYLIFFHQTLFDQEQIPEYKEKLRKEVNERIADSSLKELFEINDSTGEPYTEFEVNDRG